VIDSKFGFYEAMGQTVSHKLSAFNMTVSLGHWPHWNFNEQVFSKYTWSIEPTESLEELYRHRAQSIRDRYDYVIISYSGGADSHNVAESFVRNGLRIDELVNRFSGNKIDTSRRDRSPDNQANEAVWAATPGYERLCNLQPDLKITRWDWSEDLVNEWAVAPKSIYDINYPSPNAHIKHRLLEKCHAPLGSKVVVVYGVDKPHITYENGHFYMSFMDEIVHGQTAWMDHDASGSDCELFYWSPESIKLLIKQGHVVKKWFQSHPEMLWLLSPGHPNRQLYYDIVNGLVYPWHDPQIWQCFKQSTRFFTLEESWFINHPEHKSSLAWRKVLADLDNEVTSMYKSVTDLRPTEEAGNHILPGCYSRLYDLGI